MVQVNTKRFWLGLVIVALGLTAVMSTVCYGQIEYDENGKPIIAPVKTTLKLSKEPKLGEIVQAVLTITPDADFKTMRVLFSMNKELIIIGKKQIEMGPVQKGQTTKVKISIKPTGTYFNLESEVRGSWIKSNGETQPWGAPVKNIIYRIVVNEQTGQMGTIEEYSQHPSRRVLLYYNHCAGEWMKEPDQGFEITNRKIVETMRKFEPALSDSEALALHGDMIQGIMSGIGVSKKDASKPAKEVEDIIIRYLLKEGWLVKLKDGTKDKWFQKLKKESKEKWDKSDNDNDRSKGIFIFSGQWKYKKHLYNKDQGLLTATQDALVRQSKVRVRAYWLGSGTNWYSCYTDVSGNFVVTGYDIPIDRNIYTHPILYLWNYDNTVKVSDPTPSISTWRDPADTTIWFLNRAGSNVDTVWGGSGGHDFGAVYPESLKAGITQPKSGAVNIYSTLLNGYKYLVPTYTSSSILTAIRAMWEPAYFPPNNSSFYRCDSIYVIGEVSSVVGTDEWDDMVLLHEYGHHVQNKCATIPMAGSATWWKSYDTDKNVSYKEGWPDLFSSVVTDSIYIVNTLKSIGTVDTSYYQNTENPWDYNDRINGVSSPDSFNGGPWCRGAVAGSLWDIIDYNDEVPYTSYPVAGWPDTSLADSLDGGFSNIWNIFSLYKPYDYSTGGFIARCQNIYHVMSGWDNRLADSTGIYYGSGYGHPLALKQISTHHRIKPPPNAPVGITASLKNGVKLTWRQNTDGGIYKYMVFRWKQEGLQQNYEFMRLTPATTDTFFNDNPPSGTYKYYVMAVDTNRCESAPSSWASVTVSKGGDNVCTKTGLEISTPNPTFGPVRLNYRIAESAKVTLQIYNCLGQLVKKIIDRDMSPGCYGAYWNAQDDRGRRVSEGVYIMRLSAGSYYDVKKITVIR